MLGLGRLIKRKHIYITSLLVEEFDINQKTWVNMGKIPFEVDEEAFGEGACSDFREAFKAKSSHLMFHGKPWVIKKYKITSIETINSMGDTPEGQTRKTVQMNCLYMSRILEKVLCITRYILAQLKAT